MKPIVKWVGGKTQILNQVFNKFPDTMNNYHEIFLGGGSVLFELLRRKHENDIQVSGNIYAYDKNPVLIHMFLNIKNRSTELQDCLNNLLEKYISCETAKGNKKPNTEEEGLSSKESYYYWMRLRYNQMTPDEKNSVEGSALFIFINKTCFRGLYRMGPNGFNVPFGNYLKLTSIISDNDLYQMSQAIQQVNFIVSDFSDAISNVEEGDFVYHDPPYVPISKTSFVNYASGGFDDTEHAKLFNLLHNLNSRNIKFLMSNSDAQKVKDEFTDYNTVEIVCRRAINSKKPDSKVNELLIWN